MRIGNLLIATGFVLVLVGALVRFFPGAFAWFGNLPGDIRIDRGSSRVFIPFTSMIVISVVATVVINLVGGMLRDR